MCIESNVMYCVALCDEMVKLITRIKEKSLTPAGFEPTTSGLEHRHSTN